MEDPTKHRAVGFCQFELHSELGDVEKQERAKECQVYSWLSQPNWFWCRGIGGGAARTRQLGWALCARDWVGGWNYYASRSAMQTP